METSKRNQNKAVSDKTEGKEEKNSEGNLNINEYLNIEIKSEENNGLPQSFPRKGHLVADTKIHSEDFTCKNCSQSFISQYALNFHRTSHSGKHLHACEFCDKSFLSKDHLLSHTRTHTGDKPFSCNLCDISFAQKGNLNQHIKTHIGEKPYSCKICRKSFVRNSTLNLHMRIHTGDKRFKCEVCDKSYVQKIDMVRHHRKNHTQNVIE